MDTEHIISMWEWYCTPAPAGYERGFLLETGASPHDWTPVERQLGQGWVHPLTFPEHFRQYLGMVCPDAELGVIVTALAQSLKEAKSRLSQRNRQIRDLRRSLRK